MYEPNFDDRTWLYVKSQLDAAIARHTSVCIQPDKTFEDVLQARGAIHALKTILNLPMQHSAESANTRGRNG